MINLYWGGQIEYENGFIKGDIIRHKMWYEEFKDLINAHVEVDKITYKLNMSLCYQFGGIYNTSRVINDSSLDVMYYLAENDQNYYGQVIVEIEKISHEQTMLPINTGFVDILHNFDVSQPIQSLASHKWLNPQIYHFLCPMMIDLRQMMTLGLTNPTHKIVKIV